MYILIKKEYFLMLFFSQRYVTTYQTVLKMPKKIPCSINKVTTGMYVTPPPIPFHKKTSLLCLFKNPDYFYSHIYMLIHIRKLINTKKDTLSNL